MSGTEIAELLERGISRAYAKEHDLQRAIESCLRKGGVRFKTEACLGERSRVDFLTAAGVAIEVKIDGSIAEVLRQLVRYAIFDEVRELVLATTCYRHCEFPNVVVGKPLHLSRLYLIAAL